MKSFKQLIKTDNFKQAALKSTLILSIASVGATIITYVIEKFYGSQAIYDALTKETLPSKLPEGFNTYVTLTSIFSFVILIGGIATIYATYRIAFAAFRMKQPLEAKQHAMATTAAFWTGNFVSLALSLPLSMLLPMPKEAADLGSAFANIGAIVGSLLIALVLIPLIVYAAAKARAGREAQQLFS